MIFLDCNTERPQKIWWKQSSGLSLPVAMNNNLFLSCYQCQEYKGSNFPDIAPLKPDADDYDFDYWFEIKWETFEIQPNPLRDTHQQKRAKITIEWLGPNKDSSPVARGEIVEQFTDSSNPNDWSYKFMLERK